MNDCIDSLRQPIKIAFLAGLSLLSPQVFLLSPDFFKQGMND